MDLEIIETGNGGDLVKTTKDLSVISGLENFVYLALCGGNVEQSTPTTRVATQQDLSWWGNPLLMEKNTQIQFNSETERILNNVALNSNGRVQIDAAIGRDLQFMSDYATVTKKVSIIATDKIQIDITVQQPDNQQQNAFIFIWDATNKELSNKLYKPAISGGSGPITDSRYFSDDFDDYFG